MQKSFVEKYKLYHVLFWIILFMLWYYLRFQDFPSNSIALQVTLIKVADLAMLVYCTNLFLIPALLYRKKYVQFAVVYFSLIALSTFIKVSILGNLLIGEHFIVWTNIKARIYDNLIPHILLVSTGAAFKILIDHANAQKRIGELAKEKAEAELHFLKQQINPHFLFNSLNAVYFLIDKKNEDARNALHQFSEMLRYQLYECGGEKIPIEKEMDYLAGYIKLQQLRKGENYQVSFTISEDVKDFTIQPLLLIPFVENSFKHLSHSEIEPNQVNISVEKMNPYMHFSIKNTTGLQKTNDRPGGGIGLVNVKRRLELLYPEQHTLELRNDGRWYEADLKIVIE